jgi:peptidoglycan/LPS O-acetylase OafA/YrhL
MLLAIVSSMLLMQQWGLKKQRFQGLFRHLPAVQKLDSIANVLVWIASLTLFVGILFGSFYWNENPETVPLFKLLLTTLILILYCVVGLLKYFNKITPQKQAIAYILIFALAILSLDAVQTEKTQAPPQPDYLESPILK